MLLIKKRVMKYIDSELIHMKVSIVNVVPPLIFPLSRSQCD